MYYITTGHGGHSGGDKFVKKENKIQLNGKNIKTFTPWRDDCASFRRFNPSSGTWPAKEMFPKTESTDMIASSDLSRSNWCPESDVLPEVINLGTLLKGKNLLEISIQEAQALVKMNITIGWFQHILFMIMIKFFELGIKFPIQKCVLPI